MTLDIYRTELRKSLVIIQIGLRTSQIDIAVSYKPFLGQMQIGRIASLDVGTVNPVLECMPETPGLHLTSDG